MEGFQSLQDPKPRLLHSVPYKLPHTSFSETIMLFNTLMFLCIQFSLPEMSLILSIRKTPVHPSTKISDEASASLVPPLYTMILMIGHSNYLFSSKMFSRAVNSLEVNCVLYIFDPAVYHVSRIFLQKKN